MVIGKLRPASDTGLKNGVLAAWRTKQDRFALVPAVNAEVVVVQGEHKTAPLLRAKVSLWRTVDLRSAFKSLLVW
jgi:hypothetical protein